MPPRKEDAFLAGDRKCAAEPTQSWCYTFSARAETSQHLMECQIGHGLQPARSSSNFGWDIPSKKQIGKLMLVDISNHLMVDMATILFGLGSLGR